MALSRVVKGELPSYKVYEDDGYIAILDINPLTDGQTLVMPKKHIGSYVFDAPDDEIVGLLLAAKKVAKRMERGLGIKRLYLVFEGLDVDHLHAKLFTKPLGMGLGARANNVQLEELAKRIKGEQAQGLGNNSGRHTQKVEGD